MSFLKILDWPVFIPILFKEDWWFWVAICVAGCSLVFAFEWMFACFIHRCAMNYVLISIAILWFLFCLVLVAGLLFKNQLLINIFMHANAYIIIVKVILMILYTAHCCCCCIEPHGCGLTMLICAILLYLAMGIFLELVVQSVRVHLLVKQIFQ